MSGFDIIGFGALNMDHIYQVERIVADGETTIVGTSAAPGGSAANTIYGLAKLGLKTGFVGAIGNDPDSKALLKDFSDAGVDTSHIKIKLGHSGATLCFTDQKGRRAIYVLPGANSSLEFEDIDLAYVQQAGVLHLSSFVVERQLEIQKRVVKSLPKSVKVSFSPGAIYVAGGLNTIAPIIERTHILFLNKKEAEELTGDTYTKGAHALLTYGCHIVVVTLGKGMPIGKKGKQYAPYYIVSKDGGEIPAITLKGKKLPVDTIGAGDAFAAGFLYGLLSGKDLAECGRIGHLAATLSVSKVGARAGLPSLEELRHLHSQTNSELGSLS